MSQGKPDRIVNKEAEAVEFPSWFYGPNNQKRIFYHAAEVPEGWFDHPRKVPKPKPKPDVPHIKDITKQEISEELTRLNVEHNPRWSEKRLHDMLVEALS